jgi:hypothetical protein
MDYLAVQPQPNLAAVVAAVASVLGVPLEGHSPASTQVLPILPTGVYDEDAATVATGISYETRYRAVRAGKLTCRRIGARRLYLGEDLLNWISGRKGASSEK